jgi:hypothetical protein
MSRIVCRNCKAELPSAQEMLNALRGAHSVLYLLEQEVGDLGYGAGRVAAEVKRIVASFDVADKPMSPGDRYCDCTGGMISMSCPIHTDGSDVRE